MKIFDNLVLSLFIKIIALSIGEILPLYFFINSLGNKTKLIMYISIIAFCSILILLIILSHTMYKEWRKIHAFSFLTEQFDNIIKMGIPMGTSEYLFWIKAYKNIELKGFTIRFVPTTGIYFTDEQVPSSIIDIEKMELKWDTTDSTIQKSKNHLIEKEEPIEPNEPSKWHCWFDKSNSIVNSPENLIGIKMTIRVKQPWKGYFSLEGRTTESERFYGRIKVKVK